MESRAYFIFGDFISNTATGAAAGLATAALVGEGWAMLAGMVVGMALGMAIAMGLWLALFLWLFGAMEVMLPVMLTGMVAGMAVGMAAPMMPLDAEGGLKIGALTGVGVVLLIYLANAALRGKVKSWTS